MGTHLHYQASCLLVQFLDYMQYLIICDCQCLGPGQLSSQRANTECLRRVGKGVVEERSGLFLPRSGFFFVCHELSLNAVAVFFNKVCSLLLLSQLSTTLGNT